MATSIEQTGEFLKAWSGRKSSSTGQYISTFESGFRRISTELLQRKERAKAQALLEAPDFNIFEALRVDRYELAHSAFLAFLLDPSADHGQGILFLQDFLARCAKQAKNINDVFDCLDSGRWNVITELAIDNGRLDIVIMNPTLGFLLVIENKIDAGEQPAQLARYGQWMDHQEEYRSQVLVYLTIDGRDAGTSGNDECVRLSYRKDIAAWLATVNNQVKPERVKEGIQQYLNIIRKL